MPGPLTPDVPIAPGVPSVLRDATNSTPGDTGRLTGDAISVTASKKDQWGLYRASDNSLAVAADTVNSIGYDAEYRIADYPLQDGQFESYDKVALPFAVRVQLIKGGRFDERREFLRILDTLRADTELYNVVTPEWSHLNVNIERVSIDRSREQGANLITAELILREIRVDATATTSNSKEPSAASPVSAGTVQPDPPSAELKAITDVKPIKPFAGEIQTVQNIPLIPNTPAQSLFVPIGGVNALVTLAQKATGLYADVSVGGVPLVSSVLCRDGAPIINAPYLGFPGDLAFIDTQGNSDPDWLGLATRYALVLAR